MNPLSETRATRAVIAQAIAFLRQAFQDGLSTSATRRRGRPAPAPHVLRHA